MLSHTCQSCNQRCVESKAGPGKDQGYRTLKIGAKNKNGYKSKNLDFLIGATETITVPPSSGMPAGNYPRRG